MQTKRKPAKKQKDRNTKPQTKPVTCRGCFGASFGDCDKCRKERR